MAGSRRRLGFEALLLASIALGLPEFGAGCVTVISLENRPCPCASGYACCATTQTCLTETQICPAASGSGSAGALNAGGTASSGGTSGAAGDDAQAGAGGDPGSPRWRAVGSDDDELLPTDRVNMAIAPDGTPYVAFRGCDVCSPPAHRPYVKRYDGAWQLLPTNQLPGDKMSPALQIDVTGYLYALVDSGVYWFDGQDWIQQLPVFPLSFTDDATLVLEQGTFYTTQFNPDVGELSVVRSEGSTWQTIGSPLLGKSTGATVRVFEGTVYVANAYVTEELQEMIALRRFDGADWELVFDFAGSGVEFAVHSPELIYVSYTGPGTVPGGGSARILRLDTAGVTDLGMVPSFFDPPKFALTSAGTPYIVYLVEDFINVNVFDGTTWVDVDSRDLGNASMVPALSLDERGGSVVPYVAAASGDLVRVRKYE